MSPSPKTTIATTVEDGGATTISSVHPDILEAHILTRLDGPTLASISCASSILHILSTQDHLWFNICYCTWPSTADPRLRQVVFTFPNGGPRSFFAQSFPLPARDPTTSSNLSRPPPSKLISAVDIHYQDKLIFSEVQETETLTGWFRCSPFRIDLLDPKDVVTTKVQHPDGDEQCTALVDDMTLSWILIDPIGQRTVNLSSYKPISVKRHWLSGEVQVLFGSILAGDRKGSASELVQCEIVVTCSGSERREMQVMEVSLEVLDLDGMHLNGTNCLVILQRALEYKKGKSGERGEQGKMRHREFLEMKRGRRERKMRTEGTLDKLCVAVGVSIFAAFWFLVLCR